MKERKMQPDKVKETLCRLCIIAISDTNCKVIEEAMRDVLEIVLPKLTLDEQDKHFICEPCSNKLIAAFNFKATCIDTEDIIFPHINASKVSVVDLKEVYLKENGNIQLIDISENQRICRLCFQLVTYGFVSLNEIDVDIIGTYIPQVNFGATLNPVICGPCFDSLCTHGSFLKNCLDAQEKYKSVDKQSYIKTGEIEIKPDDQDAQEKYKTIDIRSEQIEIISVDEDEDDDSSSYDLDNVTLENKKTLDSEDVIIIEDEDMRNYETEFNENCNNQIPGSEKSSIPKCGPSQIYGCDNCKYKTKYKSKLKNHQLKHKRRSNKRAYKSDNSNYKTKRKRDLRLHQSTNEGIKMYKCDTCAYETKYRRCLKNHKLTHKDPLEIDMYRCDTSNFENEHMFCMEKHRMMHKDPSEIQTWKCNMCSFETKHKNYLNVHRLVHKGPSEIHITSVVGVFMKVNVRKI